MTTGFQRARRPEPHEQLGQLQAERLAVVGSMAAQVAHEIRNPLGAISLNVDLIGQELKAAVNSNGSSADECQALLREMRSQVLRIRQVLQEYLRFARMPKSRRTVLSLRRLFEEKLNFLQSVLDQKHVELSKTLDPELPPVRADIARDNPICIMVCPDG
mgnify:CR=1 FL=1